MTWLKRLQRSRPEVSEDMERAQALLNKARADEPKIARIVEDTKAVLHRNHLGPKIQIALGVKHR